LILHTLASDEGYPWGDLIRDPKGNLYGTIVGSNSGVFELTPIVGAWDFSFLYTNGAGPGLLMDGTGNLYGQIGPGQSDLYEAVGKLSPGSGGWTYTQLYSFL